MGDINGLKVEISSGISAEVLQAAYGAALQDRLARHISSSIGRMSDDRRIEPVESITLHIVDRLKFQEDN
ncbi:hypothetical protein [Burkholderia pseudomallei]|uniref:hypothetical protein n=1 Tax=Burkholderia pseudomallei TaxID=28450 RepID=UPI0011C4BAB6|nr:hypothetical protein [Burkholderia pseudomallei]